VGGFATSSPASNYARPRSSSARLERRVSAGFLGIMCGMVGVLII
jgi:hypothetical protein